MRRRKETARQIASVAQIARIDRLMDADLRKLGRHDTVGRLYDKMTYRQRRCSAVDWDRHWRDGWNRNPALLHRHNMLQRERNTYQDVRDGYAG